jgi:hypothetical protein
MAFYGSSDKIYAEICRTNECEPNCGITVGFVWLEKPAPEYMANNHYISSQIPNQSHDLRALNKVRQIVKKYITIKPTFKKPHIYSDVLTKVKYDGTYGTKEIVYTGLPTQINNVTDAYIALEDLITKDPIRYLNDKVYDGMSKLGNLNIFDDGTPMQFFPV